MNDDARLLELIREHWVLTLATTDPGQPNGAPYPTPLYYALLEEGGVHPFRAPCLVLAGKESSTHGQHLGKGPTPVAAAVYLETEEVGKIRGAQLRGHVVQVSECAKPVSKRLRDAYVRRHPVAAPMLVMPGQRLYAFLLTWAKLTDNRFGFGVRETYEYRPDWDALGCERP